MIVYDPTVALRYGQALFNVAKRQGKTAETLSDAEAILKAMTSDNRLRAFLESPQITTEAKDAFVKKVFEGKVEAPLFELVMLMMRKSRIESLRGVLEHFRGLVEKDQGIHEARVATAEPLDDADRKALEASLEKFTKAKLRVAYSTDSDLVGGVRFQYGDTLIDDTVRGKLDRLRRRLEESVTA